MSTRTGFFRELDRLATRMHRTLPGELRDTSV